MQGLQKEYQIFRARRFSTRTMPQGLRHQHVRMSLLKAENREAFKKDEAGYIKQFNMTPEQPRPLKRDWNACWRWAATSISRQSCCDRWAFVPAGGGDDDRLQRSSNTRTLCWRVVARRTETAANQNGEQEWLRS